MTIIHPVTHHTMRKALAAFVVFSFTPVAAWSQADDSAAVLRTVVVTATKSPADRTSLSQAVTVITREDIRSRGISRVSDALRIVPGAAVVQNGSTGSVNTLFLRGGESRYTKVLIDGVAVNAPGGFFDLSHLTTDNIDRIEVVRGPSSVVHGADAMAGVIQIFTRQGAGPASMSADARAGTYGTREAALGASGASGLARWSLAGSARRTDGIFKLNNQYYNGTLSGSLGLSPAAGTDVVLSTRYGAAEFHYPTDFTGAPVDSNAYRVQHRLTVGLDGETRLAKSVSGRMRFGTNEVSDLTEDIGVPFGAAEPAKTSQLARNKRRSAELGLTATLPYSSSLSAGIEYIYESERSKDEGGPVGGASSPISSFSADRNTRSAYAELTTGIARASVTLAGRLDDNSEYASHATYRLGASVPVSGTTRIRASLSTAFNAPAFNQVRATLYTSASPDLEPERGTSWELGGEQAFAKGRAVLSGAYFSQRFLDMIQFVPGGPPDFLGSFANLTEAESNGYEAELMIRLGKAWSGQAGYTFSQPKVTRVSESYAGTLLPGDPLIRRPRHSGNAALSWYRGQAVSLSTTAMYIGERPDIDFNEFPSPTVMLPSYVRVDVAGSLGVLRSRRGKSVVALTFRVENLFDREYEDVLNFETPGRTILVGARYTGSL